MAYKAKTAKGGRRRTSPAKRLAINPWMCSSTSAWRSRQARGFRRADQRADVRPRARPEEPGDQRQARRSPQGQGGVRRGDEDLGVPVQPDRTDAEARTKMTQMQSLKTVVRGYEDATSTKDTMVQTRTPSTSRRTPPPRASPPELDLNHAIRKGRGWSRTTSSWRNCCKRGSQVRRSPRHPGYGPAGRRELRRRPRSSSRTSS